MEIVIPASASSKILSQNKLHWPDSKVKVFHNVRNKCLCTVILHSAPHLNCTSLSIPHETVDMWLSVMSKWWVLYLLTKWSLIASFWVSFGWEYDSLFRVECFLMRNAHYLAIKYIHWMYSTCFFYSFETIFEESVMYVIHNVIFVARSNMSWKGNMKRVRCTVLDVIKSLPCASFRSK